MSNSILKITEAWIPTREVHKSKHNATTNGNYSALYKWLKTYDFSQSNKIKSGNYIEDWVKIIVANSSNVNLIDISKIEIAGHENKQADVVYIKKELIYFRETKGNVALDSEKMPATLEKIRQIGCALGKMFDKISNAGLLCPSWLTSKNDIEGFNDFIATLDYSPLSIEEHAAIGEMLGYIIRKELDKLKK